MSLSNRLSLLLASRSPRQKRFQLSQKNIYIFPSRIGFVFIALLLLMLLTAINYQSSLIYLYTFVLASVFFISIWMCFLNLSGMEVSARDQAECFAGEPLPFHVQLYSSGHPVQGLQLGVDSKHLVDAECDSGDVSSLTVYGGTASRGMRRLERLRVQSVYPFGLVQAWTWLRLDAQALVYPKPIAMVMEKSGSHVTDSDSDSPKRLTDEQTEIREYEPGDSSRRILWKHLATKDKLIVRQAEAAALDSRWVRWDDYPVGSQELKLSHMCYDVLMLNERREVYGLELPGKVIQPGQGELHKHKALAALALFGGDAAAFGGSKA